MLEFKQRSVIIQTEKIDEVTTVKFSPILSGTIGRYEDKTPLILEEVYKCVHDCLVNVTQKNSESLNRHVTNKKRLTDLDLKDIDTCFDKIKFFIPKSRYVPQPIDETILKIESLIVEQE